jgi:hypothetical protein
MVKQVHLAGPLLYKSLCQSALCRCQRTWVQLPLPGPDDLVFPFSYYLVLASHIRQSLAWFLLTTIPLQLSWGSLGLSSLTYTSSSWLLHGKGDFTPPPLHKTRCLQLSCLRQVLLKRTWIVKWAKLDPLHISKVSFQLAAEIWVSPPPSTGTHSWMQIELWNLLKLF